ncbi:MAG: SIS domain-containing protein [Blautia sp.]|nr:SIS domain-containing protein [Blautia sp.]
MKSDIFRELDSSLGNVSEAAMKAFCMRIHPGRRIFCDASGRSRLQIAGFAMRLAQMGFAAQLVGEPTSTAIRSDDVLLVCSASGNTSVIVEHARSAKKAGSQVLTITASQNSSLAELSDEMIVLNAASKKGHSELSIQPMGSLFEQSAGLLFDMLVLRIMDEYGITAEQMSDNHSNLE